MVTESWRAKGAGPCIHLLRHSKSSSYIPIDSSLPQLALPNSIKMPLSVLETELKKLDKNQSYAIFCQSGKRSIKAIEILKQHQFLNVKNIEGGVLKIQKSIENEECIY